MRREAIERLLPAVYHEAVGPGTLLGAFLDVMETLHEPDERILEELEQYFDPYTTPDRFLGYLAAWVDLDWLDYQPERAGPQIDRRRLRHLISLAPHLSRHRGTEHGLRLFLETATGVPGFSVTEDPDTDPFVVTVRAPAGARPLAELVERIVDDQKPAHTRCTIHWNDREEP